MTKLESTLLELLNEDCRIPLEKLAVMTGETLDTQTAQTVALDPVMSYKRFAVIRPSMLMDNKAE